MRKIYLLFCLLTINCFSQNEFITVWKTDNTYPNNSITIPITENTSPYTYVWEELDEEYNVISAQSVSTIIPVNNGPITITFASPGIYRIKISTDSSSFRFNNNGNQLGKDLINVEQWGNINWSSFANAFRMCSNLDITAYDIPNLSNVTDLSYMFAGCTILTFNSSISNWNVGTITDFEAMFTATFFFNQDLQRWDTSNATTMKNMFSGSQAFNTPINNWDVSNVTDFYGMFHSANYNQPLNEWQTISATNMGHMFCADLYFNQDISNFNVSQVTELDWFIQGAANFNQDLSSFQLDSVTGASSFFSNSGMDCENFTNTIANWANNPNLPNNIILGVNNMQYSNGLTPIINWFTNTKNWFFSGNMNETPECTLSNIDFQISLIKIHPNPTSDILNIEGIEVKKVDIYDAKGSLVQKTLNTNQVDISQLSTGKYLLIINNQYKENIIKK